MNQVNGSGPQLLPCTCSRIAAAVMACAAWAGTAAGSGPELAARPIWQYHGSLMVIGLLVLLSAAFLARLRPRRDWLRLHRLMGLSGSGISLVGAALAGYMVSISSGEHLAYPHAWAGLLVVGMLVLTPSLGLAQFRFRHRASQIRQTHRWSGRLTLMLMAVNILAGLRLAGAI